MRKHTLVDYCFHGNDMPVFQLSDTILFPPPELADPDGLLAVGGDLRVERLVLAYSMGIFPWYNGGEPILWWSPDPRPLIMPETLKISRSLRQTINKGVFSVTFDRAFKEVVSGCATADRKRECGTWITPEMNDAYCDLHKAGVAHSVECRVDGELVGGLYGVALGGMFCGESMFSKVSNASKVALATLAGKLWEWGFLFIDCQVSNPHLMGLGAVEFMRPEYSRLLTKALALPTKRGQWTLQSK